MFPHPGPSIGAEGKGKVHNEKLSQCNITTSYKGIQQCVEDHDLPGLPPDNTAHSAGSTA